MGLEFNTLRKQQEAEQTKMPAWTADRRLYYAALPNGTPDHSHLVEEGDPSAAWLFAAVGQVVLEADAIRYGLMEKAAAPEPEEIPSPQTVKRRPSK